MLVLQPCKRDSSKDMMFRLKACSETVLGILARYLNVNIIVASECKPEPYTATLDGHDPRRACTWAGTTIRLVLCHDHFTLALQT